VVVVGLVVVVVGKIVLVGAAVVGELSGG